MQSSGLLALLAAIMSASATKTPIDPTLIPEFGLRAGQDPDGNGNCLGSSNTLIPCFCPPDRDEFIGKVDSAVARGNFLGTPITFNVDPRAQSAKDQLNRATASLIVLQSFNGTPGVGCPAASAPNILGQQIQFANLLGKDA